MGKLFYTLQDSEEKYTDQYCLKKVDELLGGRKGKITKLYESFKEMYDPVHVNRNRFKELVMQEYQCERNNVLPYKKKASEEASPLDAYLQLPEEQLVPLLADDQGRMPSGLLHACMALLALLVKKGVLSRNKAEESCASLQQKMDADISRIQAWKQSASSRSMQFLCTMFMEGRAVREVLRRYNVHTVRDLQEKEPEFILYLISSDPDALLDQLALVENDMDQKYVQSLYGWLDLVLSKRQQEVFFLRRGINSDGALTLDEIGKKLGVTRERIRQIEKDAMQRIQNSIGLIQMNLELICRYHLAGRDPAVVSIEEIADEMKDRQAAELTACLASMADMDIHYSPQLQALYDSSRMEEQELIDAFHRKYGNYISAEQYESLKPYEKKITDLCYRTTFWNPSFHVRNGANLSELYASVIRNHFPDGYRIYDEDDYRKFAEAYVSLTGDKENVPSATALRGIIPRTGFILVDKGTYLPSDACTSIPEDLQGRMIDYIANHLPVVEYRTLYEAFHEELQACGINNRWYMKGLIDPLLPDGMITKRDYLTEEAGRVSAMEARLAWMHSINGPFTLNDMRTRFPGVKTYTFQQLLYDEQKNGLLMIDMGTYIYAGNLRLDEVDGHRLGEALKEQFAQADDKVLNSRTVFASMKERYPELFAKEPYLNSHFALFSVLMYFLHQEYCFSRPWISLDADRSLTKNSLLYEQLEKKDAFTYEDIKAELRRLNTPFTRSYVSVMEDLSSEFVQINQHAAVRKDKLEITKEQLEEIKVKTDAFLQDKEYAYARELISSASLPVLSYPWNQYLAAGIFRTFFQDFYQVERQFDKETEKMKFLIRKTGTDAISTLEGGIQDEH